MRSVSVRKAVKVGAIITSCQVALQERNGNVDVDMAWSEEASQESGSEAMRAY